MHIKEIVYRIILSFIFKLFYKSFCIAFKYMYSLKRIGHGSGADTAKGNQSKIQRENSLIVPADF